MGTASRKKTKMDLLFLGTIVVIGLAMMGYLVLRPDRAGTTARTGAEGSLTHSPCWAAC